MSPFRGDMTRRVSSSGHGTPSSAELRTTSGALPGQDRHAGAGGQGAQRLRPGELRGAALPRGVRPSAGLARTDQGPVRRPRGLRRPLGLPAVARP
ncbi:hypothetical protein [Streptomyces azureus]|uniref:hypothetical protein n=1 Tax=Streptomyces azureus TaxID=146537 RepID=UPI0011DF5E95|nr:hypothetical protein [Streptomyces azureus]